MFSSSHVLVDLIQRYSLQDALPSEGRHGEDHLCFRNFLPQATARDRLYGCSPSQSTHDIFCMPDGCWLPGKADKIAVCLDQRVGHVALSTKYE